MAYNNLLREYCAPQAKILRILIGDRPPIRRQKNKRLIPIFLFFKITNIPILFNFQIYQYLSILSQIYQYLSKKGQIYQY